MTLIDTLLQLARIWAGAQDRSLARLATIVVNDGKLFSRLEEGKTCTVTTFERFLQFFREPGNWPESIIPADAAEILDEIQIIAIGAEPFVGREVQLEAFLVAPHEKPDNATEAERSPGKGERFTDCAAEAA